MGFLKIFSGKKEEPEKPVVEGKAKEVKITEVKDWVEALTFQQIKDAKSKFEKIWVQIVDRYSTIGDALKGLEKASFDAHDKTYSAVNMLKNSFVKKAFGAVSIPAEIKFTHPTLQETYSDLNSILIALKNIPDKQAYVLSNYFSAETNKVVKNIKNAEDALEKMKEFLSSDGKVMELRDGISLKLKEREDCFESIKDIENKQDDAEKQIIKLKEEQIKKQIDLDNIPESEQWKALSEFNENLEKTNDEISEIIYKITEELSVAKRPFKKIVHEAESFSLGKEEKNLLEKAAKSPFKTFMENSEGFKSVMEKTDKIIREEKIKLKDKEKEKTLLLLNNMEHLFGLKEKYLALLTDKEKHSKRFTHLRMILDTKKTLENRLKEIENETRKLKEEKIILEDRKKKIREEIIGKKKEMENLILKNLNRKVIIIDN